MDTVLGKKFDIEFSAFLANIMKSLSNCFIHFLNPLTFLPVASFLFFPLTCHILLIVLTFSKLLIFHFSSSLAAARFSVGQR